MWRFMFLWRDFDGHGTTMDRLFCYNADASDLLTLVGDPTALMRNIYLEPGNKLGTAASLQILESADESINQSRIRLCWLPGPA